jgi:hypothetical protein
MIDKETLRKSFEKTKELTNGFTLFSPEILFKEDFPMVVFRLALSMSQRRFANLLGVSRGKISRFEQQPPIKVRDRTMAKRLMGTIETEFVSKNLSGRIGAENLLNTYDSFMSKRMLDSARSKEIRSKVAGASMRRNAWLSATTQKPKNGFEEQVFALLKSSGIDFDFHAPVQAKTKVFIVDFAIPSSKDPKVVLEVKQTKSQNTRTEYSIIWNYIVELDHKMHNIKMGNPNILALVAISNSVKPLNKIQDGIKSEILDIDDVFVDSNLSDLPIYIKSVINSNKGPVV